eukprot:688568-Pleurochrysis_carterae.AAC.5
MSVEQVQNNGAGDLRHVLQPRECPDTGDATQRNPWLERPVLRCLLWPEPPPPARLCKQAAAD